VVLLLGKPIQSDEKPLYARDGWQIPTETPLLDTIEMRRIRAKHWQQYRPRAILRSIGHLNYLYNCVGMIFAARRKWIEVDYLEGILQHDGYRQIAKNEIVVGDIVLYRNHLSEYSHVALIVQVLQIRDTINIKVLSKWGKDPEYEHFEDDVPVQMGQAVEYWTERLL
jgi:hypothetical protein